MPLTTYDSATLLQKAAAAVQAETPTPLNLNPGSVLLAFLEATKEEALWLQTLVIQLLAASRLSTASGADVDSFVADFGMTRLAAVAATGTVQFARTTTTQAATIPAGTVIQTSDGTQSFTVIADTGQAAWNATANAYLIPVGTTAVNATVQAVNAGTQGNVLANTITVLQAPIQGVQTVSNPSAFSNGVDAESDTALKVRFALFLAGLRQGTKASVGSAISNLQQGIQYTLVENQAYDGTAQNGYFYVVINPSTATLQSQVYSAIDAIRPLSVSFGVSAATTLTATVSMTVTAASGYTHAQAASNVQAAIEAFIGTIPLGGTLYWSQLYAIAYGAAGVLEVTGLTLNGGTADLVATAKQAIVAGPVTVN